MDDGGTGGMACMQHTQHEPMEQDGAQQAPRRLRALHPKYVASHLSCLHPIHIRINLIPC